MSHALPLSARLLRGFAIDFLTAHKLPAVEWVMDPAYRLNIGGHIFEGRDDAYLPATAAQLEQFPGLCVTVHDVVLGPQMAAMRFTEHGVSIRNPGCAAAWGGITLFDLHEAGLRQGWAEEDYFARKRQLKTGLCDPVRTPAAAPWDAPCLPPDADTERAVQAWLADAHSVLDDTTARAICAEGPAFAELIDPSDAQVTRLFTAGPRAAFHLELHGAYAGGFEDVDSARRGQPILLRMAGLADVAGGGVTHAQVSADRLGLHRELLGGRPA